MPVIRRCPICAGAGTLPYRDGSGVYLCAPCKGTGDHGRSTARHPRCSQSAARGGGHACESCHSPGNFGGFSGDGLVRNPVVIGRDTPLQAIAPMSVRTGADMSSHAASDERPDKSLTLWGVPVVMDDTLLPGIFVVLGGRSGDSVPRPCGD